MFTCDRQGYGAFGSVTKLLNCETIRVMSSFDDDFSQHVIDFETATEAEQLLQVKSSLAMSVMELCADMIVCTDDESAEEQMARDDIIIDGISTALVHYLISYFIRNKVTNTDEAFENAIDSIRTGFKKLLHKKVIELN